MNYKELSPKSRVWIYQSSRVFTNTEAQQIREGGARFIASWATHGTPLQAAMEVFYNRFVVLLADEAQVKASGCSIDASVQFMKEVENAFKVNLFDRLQIAYREGDSIQTMHMNDLKDAVVSGSFSNETIIFNNLVQTKEELESKWEVPVKESWLYSQLA